MLIGYFTLLKPSRAPDFEWIFLGYVIRDSRLEAHGRRLCLVEILDASTFSTMLACPSREP